MLALSLQTGGLPLVCPFILVESQAGVLGKAVRKVYLLVVHYGGREAFCALVVQLLVF